MTLSTRTDKWMYLPFKSNRHISIFGSSWKRESLVDEAELGLILVGRNCCFQRDGFRRDHFFIFSRGYDEWG